MVSSIIICGPFLCLYAAKVHVDQLSIPMVPGSDYTNDL